MKSVLLFLEFELQMNMQDKIRIAFTLGDFNGIGLEVILKALSHKALLNMVTPIIYGSPKVISYHKNIIKDLNIHFFNIKPGQKPNRDKINVVNCWDDDVNITLGKPTQESGKSAALALDKAVQDIKSGFADALVTAPVSKEALQMADFQFPGHTEFLEKMWNGEALMLMVSDRMKIAMATGHIPLNKVRENLTKEKISGILTNFRQSLIKDFGITKPIIAVLGLNPHAGENGLLGKEEDEFIRPVIIEAKKQGHLVMGPYAADGFFGSGEYAKFDGILAMYHDQGLIPFKTVSFQEGVNFTAGLDFVRTSPDHGTAYPLAGKNKAAAGSMIKAIYEAITIFRNRKEYYEDREAAIIKGPKPSEEA